MGMVVRSNIMAMNANRQLGVNNSAVSKNLEKLSSGFKINRAGDDASGLAISEKMKAQIKGLETASSNAQDGISLVQTAEGALTEVHDMLNRMVELATKSANGTIKNEVDREAIQSEVDALNDEIDRISQSTNFNGINLLDGSLGGGSVSKTTKGYEKVVMTQTTAAGVVTVTNSTKATGNKGKETVTIGDAAAAVGDAQELTVNFVLDGKAHSITFKGDATAATEAGAAGGLFADADAKKAFDALGITVTNTGAALAFEMKETGKTDFQIYSVAHKNDGTAAATAATVAHTTAGTDDTLTMTAGTTAGTAIEFEIDGKKFQVVKTGESAKSGYTALYTDTGIMGDADATSAVIAQLKNKGIEATSTAAGTLVFKAGKTTTTAGTGSGLTLQIGDTNDEFNKVTVSVEDMSATGLGTQGLDVSNQDAAGDSVKVIKDAINKVSTNRATLGALQNRLEHTINNLDVASENMSAANSRIRDTDMAKQMMEYTKMNVLTQAAQAMLAQANQQPQSILQLLQ